MNRAVKYTFMRKDTCVSQPYSKSNPPPYSGEYKSVESVELLGKLVAHDGKLVTGLGIEIHALTKE